MAEISTIPDCSRCAALCCVAFAFDRRQGFPIDKRNGEPCPHLDAAMGCRIYAERGSLGFEGCITYDCYGAGQRVTQELFGGRSWRDEPGLLPAMTETFIAMRAVHELIFLLKAAAAMPLSEKDRFIIRVLAARLCPDGGWPRDQLLSFRQGRLERCIRKFLGSLRRYYAQKASPADAG